MHYQKHNEEAKKKMSEAHKKIGAPWMIGNVTSEETKEKQRNAKVGRRLTKEHRNKISESGKGRKHSKETLRKIQETKKKNFDKKGRKTVISLLVRGLLRYRQWRSDVFTRDNFTCQQCFTKGGELNADHIKPFSTIMNENNIKTTEEAEKCEELWNINNGKTLCKKCHKKTPTYARNFK